MTNDPVLCAMCGAPIVPAGEAWAHVGELQPRHPAIPVGEWHPSPAESALLSVSGAFAAEIIRRRLSAGGRIEIPSLGIVIDPKEAKSDDD
jgi:hypothetical protein